MAIFFYIEKTPEGRELRGIYKDVHSFIKDYSIDIALGKENLR
jgi:hypothetical protein